MRKTRMMHCFAFTPLAVALLLVGGFAHAQSGDPATAKHLVDIGAGRHMNFVCMGHGSPAVVFEYGLGGHLPNWQKVQAPIAALTTACFYDRAGYGTRDRKSVV